MISAIDRRKLKDRKKYEGVGFTIREVGMGDGIQFTSLPENYFRATGEKLIDLSKSWYFDYNPYIHRDFAEEDVNRVVELWNYPKIYEWPTVRSSVYLSNAEIHASVLGIQNPKLIRPKLYHWEDFPFEWRDTILFHPHGRSHGSLPDHVIDHVIKKYGPSGDLYQIGCSDEPSLGIRRFETHTVWDLVKVISECRMLIGVDSGPAWIAACYPDVVVKKIRTKFQFGYCEPKDWVPLDVKNEHSFWDDRAFQVFNTFEEDVGFTYSYRKL